MGTVDTTKERLQASVVCTTECQDDNDDKSRGGGDGEVGRRDEEVCKILGCGDCLVAGQRHVIAAKTLL